MVEGLREGGEVGFEVCLEWGGNGVSELSADEPGLILECVEGFVQCHCFVLLFGSILCFLYFLFSVFMLSFANSLMPNNEPNEW